MHRHAGPKSLGPSGGLPIWFSLSRKKEFPRKPTPKEQMSGQKSLTHSKADRASGVFGFEHRPK